MDPRDGDHYRRAHYTYVPGDDEEKKRKRLTPDDFAWWLWLVTGLIVGACVTGAVLIIQGRLLP